MASNELTDKYLSDICEFKTKFSYLIKDTLQPNYTDIASPYLNCIIAYCVSIAELTNQFSLIQQHKMFASSLILSRSIFEEAAIINTLIKEKKDNLKSNFYKYLFIQDMYQDLRINKAWKSSSTDYWRRIHSLLLKEFPSELQNKNIRLFSQNPDSFSGYSTSEQNDLDEIVSNLRKMKCYNYYPTALCADLFDNVYSKTDMATIDVQSEAKCDIKAIYGLLCHYSHSNLSAIDDLHFIKGESTIPKICYNKEINNNNKVVLQWMKYTLDYIYIKLKDETV